MGVAAAERGVEGAGGSATAGASGRCEAVAGEHGINHDGVNRLPAAAFGTMGKSGVDGEGNPSSAADV